MRLRINIASPLLLDCLRKIMASKAFDDLYLVGGTALALQRGHRISIDIDFRQHHRRIQKASFAQRLFRNPLSERQILGIYS